MTGDGEYIIIGVNSKNKEKAIIALSKEGIGIELFRGLKLNIKASFNSILPYYNPSFNEDEKFISDCFKVFKYNNSVEVFNSLDCERKTGITRYHCNKIYDKYLKE